MSELQSSGLPSERWELTAPESYLLRYAGTRPSAVEVFKIALKELVARDVLRLQSARLSRRWGLGTRREWLLTDGPRMDSVTEAALAPILSLYVGLRDRRARLGILASAPDVPVSGVLPADLHRAGAAVLLISDAYPALARLGQTIRAASLDDQPYAFAVGPPRDDRGLELSAQVGDLAFDAFDGIDAAFATIDTSIGGFSGDGGGGDGGGGGGLARQAPPTAPTAGDGASGRRGARAASPPSERPCRVPRIRSAAPRTGRDAR